MSCVTPNPLPLPPVITGSLCMDSPGPNPGPRLFQQSPDGIPASTLASFALSSQGTRPQQQDLLKHTAGPVVPLARAFPFTQAKAEVPTLESHTKVMGPRLVPRRQTWS